MLHDRSGTGGGTSSGDRDQEEEYEIIRDIHAVTSPALLPPPPGGNRGRRTREPAGWETSSLRSTSLSVASSTEGALSDNFTTMSREFNALVLAGTAIENHNGTEAGNGPSTSTNNGASAGMMMQSLARIGEEYDHDHDHQVEINPLAIVPDSSTAPLGGDPVPSPRARVTGYSSTGRNNNNNMIVEDVSIHTVKKEEVESKISAWQTAKISKVNNRFKREDAIINGWESEEVQKAATWMKKVERKLEEKRAKALEKMQNDVAKARRKAEEKRASAEAKRGTKVARILEVSNLMRAVGRAPTKRSFF